MFLTFIESILVNLNGVVCLSFLFNEIDIEMFCNNENDTLETFIHFSVMEDKTIMDQKNIIISDIQLQIIFQNRFVVRYH